MTTESNPHLDSPTPSQSSPSARRSSSRRSASRFVGQIIADRYRIERLIARGAMGQVYAGTELDVDRPVAIKILPLREQARDQRYRRRFRREASITSRLQHPNI